jgi:predicted nuclease with TOPRIM domain
MKNQSYYETQYQLQKKQQENSRDEKIRNINSEISRIQVKIDNLSFQLERLKETKQKLEQKEFPSFEEFYTCIHQQSQQAKKKAKTPNAEDPGNSNLLISE